MRLFGTVGIIGTGLIGGSLAQGIKKKGLAERVLGVSRSQTTARLARKLGIVDASSTDIGLIKDADLVVFAAPVEATLSLAPRVAGIIGKDCIVSDVASTKRLIVKEFSRLFPRYIGTHPLAGLEKSGVRYADQEIFRGALCIFTPTAATDPRALAKIKKLWFSLGSKVTLLDPALHDRALSLVSHLPHAAAFSLMRCIPKEYLPFASGGLKDTTRIAASDAHLWSEIFLSNKKNLLVAIRAFEAQTALLKKALQKDDKALLVKLLQQAKDRREMLG